MTNPLLEAALGYAERGWHVFPLHHLVTPAPDELRCSCGDRACSNMAKHPITHSGFKDATTDPDVIRRWWTRRPAANIGIRTGAVSGLFVVDVDAGKDGFDTLAKLEAANDSLLTLECGTGGDGAHLYFTHPGGTISNSNRHLRDRYGPGIDVRGDGGYVVAPPSLHRTGHRYQWCDGDHAVTELCEVPTWFLAALAPPPPPKPQPRQVVHLDDQRLKKRASYYRATMDGILAKLEREGEGNRNNLLFWAGKKAGELIAEGAPTEFIEDLYEAGRMIGLGEQETYRTLRSALGADLVASALGGRVS